MTHFWHVLIMLLLFLNVSCHFSIKYHSQFLKIHEKDKLKLITFNSRLIPAFWLDSFRNDTNMKIAHTNQCYVNEPFSLEYTSALNLCQRQRLSRIFMKFYMKISEFKLFQKHFSDSKYLS